MCALKKSFATSYAHLHDERDAVPLRIVDEKLDASVSVLDYSIRSHHFMLKKKSKRENAAVVCACWKDFQAHVGVTDPGGTVLSSR